MSSYASYLDAAAEVEQALAKVQAALPFLGDDIFALIAAELDARMLGRLGCAAQRFARPSVPDPAHQGTAPAELWSVAEEGARRRLCAQSEQVRGWVCRGGVGGSWLRALGEAEKLQRPLRFTVHSGSVVLRDEVSDEVTLSVATMVQNAGFIWSGFRSAACGGHEMRRGRHYATFTFLTAPHYGTRVGVIGGGFDPTALLPGWSNSQSKAWLLSANNGALYHQDRRTSCEGIRVCERKLKQGDVVVGAHSHPRLFPCPR